MSAPSSSSSSACVVVSLWGIDIEGDAAGPGKAGHQPRYGFPSFIPTFQKGTGGGFFGFCGFFFTVAQQSVFSSGDVDFGTTGVVSGSLSSVGGGSLASAFLFFFFRLFRFDVEVEVDAPS